MADTPQDQARKIQDEINKLSGQTKQHWQNILDNIDLANVSADDLGELLDSVQDTVEKINGGLDYTSRVFEKIVDQLKEGNKTLQYQDTLLSKANSIARETLEIRKGEIYADASHIQNLQNQSQLYLDQLIAIKKTQEARGEDTTEITKQIEGLQHVGSELEDISNRNKELNKGFVGTAPALAKMFSDSKLIGGSLTQAYQTTMQLGQGAKAAGIEFNTMGTFAKAFGTQLRTALGPIGLLIMAIEQIQEAIKLSDQGAGDLAKGFNITYDEANRVREQLTDIAEVSGDVNVTTRGLQESMVAVGKALGSNAMLAKEDLVFMTKMREQAGFTNDELVGMQKYTLATGGNLEENTKNLMFAAKTTALNNGVLLNEKDIMKDIANTSDAIKLSIAGGATGLGKAAAQAKAFGMSLEQVDKIAGSLLDFEQSINAELEAELLTGKDLNLEQARLYAINNDLEGLSREIAKNYGSAAEFGKMNRLQQEAAAKAVGMSREELAKSLTDAEALKGLSGKQAEDAKVALDAARARGMSEEEIAQQGIDNLMKQQSVQERMNKAVEKMKEIFVAIAEPILDIISPLADLATAILPPILGFLKPILGVFSSIAHIVGAIVRLLTLDIKGAMESFKSAGSSLTKGITGSTQFKMANTISGGALNEAVGVEDAQISPDGGLVVSGTKGTYSLDKNDTVIAGTNLDKGNNTSSSPSLDLTSLINEIKTLKQEITKISQQPIIIENSVDGTKFGTAVAVRTVKTQ